MSEFIVFIKKYKWLYEIISELLNILFNFISFINPVLASRIKYRHYFHRKLNLKNPSTLNEKMMYLKLYCYWNEKTISDCADKYAVRKIIESKGCPEILNDLLGVYETVDEIIWDDLPNKFVIKCNHGSGYNIICTNKLSFDIEEAKKKIKKWMNENYGISTVEQGIYSNIRKKIIIEKFIETKDCLPPKDYKFFCSYGEVKFLFLASDRINNQTKFDYYYPDWTWIPVKNQHPNNGPIDKPEYLQSMIKYAETLSKDFPLVRIDLYNEANQIIFGEYTFTHFGCLNTFDPIDYDLIFGQCFPEISKISKIRNEQIII